MPTSLQDQLKKSGLVDNKKAKKLSRAKHKEEKHARKGKKSSVDPRKVELERVKSEKIARDKQLNQEKNAKAELKALSAQIKQLIEMNIIAKDGEQKFSFSDANKIKHIWVSQAQIERLSHGTIAIVTIAATDNLESKHDKQHVLVPMGVAEKIALRDESAVIFKAEKTKANDEDDPYAAFQIPDDLTW
ncbi:MAG: nucleoprotein/polynucleotide-associated enzyme [SAR86 cluster bacterium]|uniref:Nucleoprotein/polynucleotide-associated enzyme n=1 Tax=SAR86 cluster bacterium TaxID=2030880 RepID=A0A2A5B861_9GAMM|nr:MAG: nucleoprotein/polynucleotide-associated enzyme [SAR86 cluster bacterium]